MSNVHTDMDDVTEFDCAKPIDTLSEALARLERKLTDMAGWFPLDNLARLALDARDALHRADHSAGVNKMVEPIRKLERVIDRLDIVGPGPEDAILIDEGRQAIAILREALERIEQKVDGCGTCFRRDPIGDIARDALAKVRGGES